jgi:hypothetical protein
MTSNDKKKREHALASNRAIQLSIISKMQHNFFINMSAENSEYSVSYSPPKFEFIFKKVLMSECAFG